MEHNAKVVSKKVGWVAVGIVLKSEVHLSAEASQPVGNAGF